MLRRFILLAAIFCAPMCASAQSLESFAKQITLLGTDHFLYGFREWSMLPVETREPIRRFAQFMESRDWRPADFLPLLAHREAKVRTLALVALYALDDPKVLPDIFSLVGDRAETFPTVYPVAHLAWPRRVTPQMLRKQSVGDIAEAIVRTYMEQGGFHYGPHGLHGQPGFEEYWKARAHRTSSAGWWAVRLARTSHNSSPTPQARHLSIRRLRTQIDRVAQPERTYILLSLRGNNGAEVLVTDEELLVMLKALESQRLIDLLQRRIGSDDPDLQARPSNNYSYSKMCLFVLRHAGELLRPEHSAALLAQETWERDYQQRNITDPLIDAWWAIAAAQLAPESAPAILRDAFARFQDDYQGSHRLELAMAVWRQLGDAATAADWFYQQLRRPSSRESYYLGQMMAERARPLQPLLKVLIDDAAFDELNWRSVETLVRAMNTIAARAIVDEEELRSAWSPGGIDFYFNDYAKQMAEYPKETAQLLEKLAQWRRALRQGAAAL